MGLLLLSTSVDWTLGNLITRERNAGGRQALGGDERRRQPPLPRLLQVLQLLRGLGRRAASLRLGATPHRLPPGRRAAGGHLVLHVPEHQLHRRRLPGGGGAREGSRSTSRSSWPSSRTWWPGRSCTRASSCPRCSAAERVRWDEVMSGFNLACGASSRRSSSPTTWRPSRHPVFARQLGFQPGVIHLGALAFAFQIYCDFSGYTDIARGVARMMGFRLMDNFNQPVLLDVHHRLLAALAHQPVDLAARLPLRPARRQPRRRRPHVSEPDAHHGAGRPLARRRLELRALGHLPGPAPGPGAGLRRQAPGARLGHLPDLGARASLGAARAGDVPFRLPRAGSSSGARTSAPSPPGRALRGPARLGRECLFPQAAQALAYIAPVLAHGPLPVLQEEGADRPGGAPPPPRGASTSLGIWAFVAFGRFESSAFIYFQF